MRPWRRPRTRYQKERQKLIQHYLGIALDCLDDCNQKLADRAFKCASDVAKRRIDPNCKKGKRHIRRHAWRFALRVAPLLEALPD